MKIIFDNIIFNGQKTGGISVVWYELLKRIILDTRFACFFIEDPDSKNNIFRKKLNLNTNTLLKQGLIFKFRRYINPKINLNNKFIFHSSYYRTSNNPNAINITTVHDFTYEYFSKGLKRFIHTYQKNRAIRNSNFIICISENTKKDLLKFVKGVDENKIRVIYNGVSENYFQIKNTNLNLLPFEKNSFVVFVGARGGYKNFSFAVEAISQSNKNFIIVGKQFTKKELDFLNSKISKTRYRLFTQISDDFLNIIYNNAFCLFYPSKYEGFGIPVLEAQQAGCPVIAYNGSSIPEIIGDTELIFNDFDINTIVKLFIIINNVDKRKLIIQAGIKNASRFSWDRMVKNVTELYLESL